MVEHRGKHISRENESVQKIRVQVLIILRRNRKVLGRGGQPPNLFFSKTHKMNIKDLILAEKSNSSTEILEILNGEWERTSNGTEGYTLSFYSLPVGMMMDIPSSTTGDYRITETEYLRSKVNSKYEAEVQVFTDPEEGPLQVLHHNSQPYQKGPDGKPAPTDHDMITMAWVVEKIQFRSVSDGIIPILTRSEVNTYLQTILDDGY